MLFDTNEAIARGIADIGHLVDSLFGFLVHVLDVERQLVICLIITVTHQLSGKLFVLLFHNSSVSTLLRLLHVQHVVVEHLELAARNIILPV